MWWTSWRGRAVQIYSSCWTSGGRTTRSRSTGCRSSSSTSTGTTSRCTRWRIWTIRDTRSSKKSLSILYATSWQQPYAVRLRSSASARRSSTLPTSNCEMWSRSTSNWAKANWQMMASCRASTLTRSSSSRPDSSTRQRATKSSVKWIS